MLEIRNLTVAYGGVVAINDANLDVAAGRMVAIVGANGAGKTTLLNTISGVARSAGGTIRFDGRQIAGLPGHKVAQLGIVQVPEGRQILAPLTVEENLRLGHLAAQDRSQNINQDLERVLELFPMLRESLDRPAGRLSGGQQQMLAIGRALMGCPRLLLLDEPSLGLAPVVVGQVFGMLQKLHSEGLTILLVEQNARRALSVSSYAYVMERGRMVKEGESEALIEDAAVIAHYLGQKTERYADCSPFAVGDGPMTGDRGRPTIIVTGAGSGIGYETAICLAARYVHVLCWDVDPVRLAATPSPHLAFAKVDVRDGARMRELVEEAEGKDHRIDGLVCCAAIFRRVPFLDLDEETFDAHMAINLEGTFLACQAVLPVLRRRKTGSIVVFSSSIARSGSATGAHYAATKGGLLGLMRSLALEAAADGIRVNAISPGVTDTPQPRGHSTEEQLYAKAKDIPLGRIGTPREMAQAVEFLLGPRSSYVTGQDIRVNGGSQLI